MSLTKVQEELVSKRHLRLKYVGVTFGDKDPEGDGEGDEAEEARRTGSTASPLASSGRRERVERYRPSSLTLKLMPLMCSRACDHATSMRISML